MAEQRAVDELTGRLGRAFHDVVGDGLARDRQRDRLAHAHVLERVLRQRPAGLVGHERRDLARRIHVQVHQAERRHLEHRDRRIGRQPFDVGRRHALDDLHVAGQQRGHARGVGGQDAQRHAIPLRLLAPVGVVARQLQAVALGERDELVRSGADQRAAVVEIVGAGFLGGLLRHDVEGRQVVRHQRVRSVGGDAHGQLVERRDVLEAACVDGVRRRAVLDGGRPGQRVHHVGRGEFAAVVELHAGAQLELPHGVADGPPGDRQAGPHAHLVVLGDQRLEQVLGDVRVGGDVVEVRVERGDVARQADHQRGRRLRVGRGGCERHGKGQRGDRTRGAQQTQDQHDDSPKC